MPFFDQSRDMTITGGQMNDVAGDQTINNNSTNTTRDNCDNTDTTNVTDSYNDHSKRHILQGNIYNSNSGMGTFNSIQGTQMNEASPRSVSHSKRINPRDPHYNRGGYAPQQPKLLPPIQNTPQSWMNGSHAGYLQASRSSPDVVNSQYPMPEYKSKNPFAAYAAQYIQQSSPPLPSPWVRSASAAPAVGSDGLPKAPYDAICEPGSADEAEWEDIPDGASPRFKVREEA